MERSVNEISLDAVWQTEYQWWQNRVCSNRHPWATIQGSCWLACSRGCSSVACSVGQELSNMSLQVNINNTCKAVCYYITNVRRIGKYLSNQATQTFVHALIIGRTDYWNSILYGLPAKQIPKFQRFQNSAARLIFKIPKFYHISPILCIVHWLPVEFRIHFKIIIITFKAIHGQAPVYLQELISKREEKRYNLRSCAMGIMLQTPRTLTKKTLGDRAFLAAAPKLWNGLPSQIRNEPNFHSFKGLRKTHFFRLAFY